MNKLIALCSVKRFLDIRALSIRITADGKDVPKKKRVENRVTLIGPDNSLSITSLENARSLSLRRELKLVKIQDEDSKTRRPIYKLMTNKQYHEEEILKRKEKQVSKNNSIKGQKLLTLTSRIADHDIMTNVKKIQKLLEKQYEVKVIISGSEQDGPRFEQIYSIMEKNLSTVGKILQKKDKGNSLRFHFLPIVNASSNAEGHSSDDKNNDKGPL